MVCLTVALIFVFFGFILMKFPPKRINGVYGYRTLFSMKNQNTWDAAQKCGGFSMIIFGILNGIFGAWAYFQPMNVNNQKSQLLFLVIASLAMIVIDEIYLRKLFNNDGTKKEI